jgi:hypothetical protein
VRRTLLLVLVCLALVPITSAPTSAMAGSVSAVLDGRPIDPDQVGDYYCHDFDYPIIRCYHSSAALDRAVADRADAGGQGTSAPNPNGAAAVNYVRIFADASYGGVSMYLSNAYARLGDIGWNDRISSFKTLASAGGTFWQHTFGGGWGYPFCCLSGVTYVGDAYNDQFSSVYPN